MSNIVDSPIKVLAIVHSMNRGGLESRLMDIMRSIDHSKVRIDIYSYSFTKGIFDDEITAMGSNIYYNKCLTVFNMLTYPCYFARFLKEHPEYQIIHAHQDAWCPIFCKGAKIAGVPVRIAHSRTAATKLTLKNCVRNIIKLPVKKYATHYFAVSDVAAIWLFGKKAYDDGKVTIWPNAIDTSRYIYNSQIRDKKRMELGIDNQFVLLHVGNFVEAKNHSFLIAVFYAFLKNHPQSTLLLAGGGDSSFLQEKCRNLGISENVCFLGSRNDVPELLQASDVFVFPSLFEGLPGALLEAQAAGLPCVVSSNITSEAVIVNDIVKSLPLSCDIKQWCVAIDQMKTIKRQNTLQYFIQKGFDIKEMVSRLTDFYINVRG